MIDCYICGKNTETPKVLVQEEDAQNDSKMYHNNYYPIYLCLGCWIPIKDRLDIEEKNHINRIRIFARDHPDMAYKWAQDWLDSNMGSNDGLAVRDIISNERK